MINALEKREANQGKVTGSFVQGYQLILPASKDKGYCLAQVDDDKHFYRHRFPHQPPIKMSLEARVSGLDLPGTWGFGLWNDPFSFGLLAGGAARLLPVLPNAAWFFYGSGENYLSLRDDLPASGFHVKTFCSPRMPSLASIAALPLAPLLFWPAAARALRKLARRIVREDGKDINLDVREWHSYQMVWRKGDVCFEVDNQLVFQTEISPVSKMGIVIWIDNQYFRFDSQGKIGFGTIKISVEQRLEIRNFSIMGLSY